MADTMSRAFCGERAATTLSKRRVSASESSLSSGSGEE